MGGRSPETLPVHGSTEEEISVKFNALGGDVIGLDQCARLRSAIMHMETASSLDELLSLTTARQRVAVHA